MPCWTDRSTARTRVAQARGRVALDGAGRAGLSLRAQPRRECRWSVVHPVSLPRSRSSGATRATAWRSVRGLQSAGRSHVERDQAGAGRRRGSRGATLGHAGAGARVVCAIAQEARSLENVGEARALRRRGPGRLLRRDGQRSPPHPAASPRRQRLGCAVRHQRDLLGPPSRLCERVLAPPRRGSPGRAEPSRSRHRGGVVPDARQGRRPCLAPRPSSPHVPRITRARERVHDAGAAPARSRGSDARGRRRAAPHRRLRRPTPPGGRSRAATAARRRLQALDHPPRGCGGGARARGLGAHRRSEGDTRVRGRWLFRPERWLDVGPATVDANGVDIFFGSHPLATGVVGRSGQRCIRSTCAGPADSPSSRTSRPAGSSGPRDCRGGGAARSGERRHARAGRRPLRRAADSWTMAGSTRDARWGR